MNKAQLTERKSVLEAELSEIDAALLPLERMAKPWGPSEGLYGKYVVMSNGKALGGCFVLRPDKDKAALKALITYAEHTDNEELRKDIVKWAASIQRDEGQTKINQKENLLMNKIEPEQKQPKWKVDQQEAKIRQLKCTHPEHERFTYNHGYHTICMLCQKEM